ncbi:class I SAM-dependent methyltransferase [Nocardia terpenica]|uniref:Methyltransferase domain-containing protein n=1 Tax=Nocardia terpenica TaxID=455432 RepID=A0A6G9Z4S4_9NOCA|nr:class I SAM-dependent methyltransferase [Nocardia terpenica]QIS20538.1 hypothetical protein F6W96_21800 [Nocardia terpenica]
MGTVLELGAGYGTTAVALARGGYRVAAVEFSDRVDVVAAVPEVVSGAVAVHKADFYDVEHCDRHLVGDKRSRPSDQPVPALLLPR